MIAIEMLLGMAVRYSGICKRLKPGSTDFRRKYKSPASDRCSHQSGKQWWRPFEHEREVIGINAAKYSSTEVEGIGYAIPVSGVQEILDELMNRKTRSEVEESRRGYLGIQGTTVDEETAATFDMPKGVYVYKILEDGAAAGSELREKILSPSWMA